MKDDDLKKITKKITPRKKGILEKRRNIWKEKEGGSARTKKASERKRKVYEKLQLESFEERQLEEQKNIIEQFDSVQNALKRDIL